jgi:hypothetical protein
LFATLDQGDWVDGVYTHQFTTSYASATFQQRVFDGGVLKHEHSTREPVVIEAGTTAVGPSTEMDFALAVLGSPIPTRPARIEYRAPEGKPVRIEVFDMLGRRVRRVASGTASGARERLTWDGTTDDGRRAMRGVYAVRLKSGSQKVVARLVLLD